MQRSSFDLRHKWAFDAAYAQVATPQVNLPRFEDYQADLEDILADKDFSPRETVLHAKALYALLLEGDHAGGWAGHARHHRRAVGFLVFFIITLRGFSCFSNIGSEDAAWCMYVAGGYTEHGGRYHETGSDKVKVGSIGESVVPGVGASGSSGWDEY